jgi:hypothetical protein
MSSSKWTFAPRFRRGSFGWKSSAPVLRIREAVKEIKAAARKRPVEGAEGAVLFLEKVVPATKRVDDSRGYLAGAVYKAVKELIPVIAKAPADPAVREDWLERLRTAVMDTDIPYLEILGDSWGELCGSPETAGAWADEWLPRIRFSLAAPDTRVGWAVLYPMVFSSLLAAGRCREVADLIRVNAEEFWFLGIWKVRALALLDRVDEALAMAQEYCTGSWYDQRIFAECELILRGAGRMREAYSMYGLKRPVSSTYLALYTSLKRDYPEIPPEEILDDLLAAAPENPGTWFAAARRRAAGPKFI